MKNIRKLCLHARECDEIFTNVQCELMFKAINLLYLFEGKISRYPDYLFSTMKVSILSLYTEVKRRQEWKIFNDKFEANVDVYTSIVYRSQKKKKGMGKN